MKRFLLALVWLLLASSVYAQPQPVLTPPSYASLPATCTVGSLVTKTTATAGLYVCSAANTWTIVTSGGSGAPTNATYITQTANSSLSAEQALGALSTGLMNAATTTGVVSTLAPTDDNVVIGNGTAWELKALPSCSAGTSALSYNTTTNAVGCNTISGTFSGSIATNQVAYATGTNALGGFGTWNGTNFFPPNLAGLTTSATAGLDFYSTILNSDADGALLTPVLAGGGAGNLSNGVYSYKFTINAYQGDTDSYSGETAAGTSTPTVTVTDASSDGKVTVQLPYTCDEASGETVNIYRTAAGGSTYKLVDSQQFACGRLYTDNIADASLGVNAPSVNTTINRRFSLVNSSLQFPWGDGFNDPVLNIGRPYASNNSLYEILGAGPLLADQEGVSLRIAAGRSSGFRPGGGLTLEGGRAQSATNDGQSANGGGVSISGGTGKLDGNGGTIYIAGGTKGSGSGVNGTVNVSGSAIGLSGTLNGLTFTTIVAPAGSGLKRFLCIDENGVVTSQATVCAT